MGSAGRYSPEPRDKRAFSEHFDRCYSRFARAYDLAVNLLPIWRGWLRHALPHIQGPRVLEVSPGTGWLLTQYAGRFETHAVDLNPELVEIARRNLRRAGVMAELRVGDVEALPYPEASFDTVVSTMAFSGYPDGRAALAELVRVMRPAGRLVIIDANYPADANRLGTALVELWKRSGDLIRDMHALFAEFELEAVDREIGGFGSVHLYLAKRGQPGIGTRSGEASGSAAPLSREAGQARVLLLRRRADVREASPGPRSCVEGGARRPRHHEARDTRQVGRRACRRRRVVPPLRQWAGDPRRLLRRRRCFGNNETLDRL